jgi:hypothetical protein
MGASRFEHCAIGARIDDRLRPIERAQPARNRGRQAFRRFGSWFHWRSQSIKRGNRAEGSSIE